MTIIFRILILVVGLTLFTNPTDAQTPPSENLGKKGLDKFMALPYLQGYREAAEESGVTVYNRALTEKGYNLYVSGHAPDAGIMDMKGNILHQWVFDSREIYPDGELAVPYRRVHLLENGDLLAILETVGLVKLDRHSKLLWFYPGEIHHHLQVAENGNIYALAREERVVRKNNEDKEIYEEFVFIFSPDGELLEKISIYKAFEYSPYHHFLDKTVDMKDIFHTNTIQILDGYHAKRSEIFKKGNLMIAIRNIRALCMLDPGKKQIVWAVNGYEHGLWEVIHEPILLENGNILLFDNTARSEMLGTSKVIEFNPLSLKMVWEYKGDKRNPFFSLKCGTNQRLDNGNTLITETDRGRAFEVTKEGKIVWEYLSPHRVGEDDKYAADLLHVHRIKPESVPWLKR